MLKHHLIQKVFLISLLFVLLLQAVPVYADDGTILLSNGAFYTQTSQQPGFGFTITDEGTDNRGQTIRFWSEFRRLGSVPVLGYPVSRRFTWDGFLCQATQRVVMQWRPETRSVAFVNVFDLASSMGKDAYLEAVRQIPKPVSYNDAGKPFQQIVNERLHLLDARPALRAAYLLYGNAAVELNGLPVAPVQDMGDAYVLRAQRVVFQEWKRTAPWAAAGQVTIALGGDIAKEIGLIQAQSPAAIMPVARPPGTSGSVDITQLSPDPLLQQAAQQLLEYDRQHDTSYIQMLVQGHVQVQFASLPRNVLGIWDSRSKMIQIADWVKPDGVPATTGILAHESYHAYDSLHGVPMETGQDCYLEEMHAFMHMADVWNWLYPHGKSDPQNNIERQLNYLLYQLQYNPEQWIYEFMQLYKSECGPLRLP